MSIPQTSTGRAAGLTISAVSLIGLAVLLLTSLPSPRPTVIAIHPTRTGATEYCLTCHAGVEAISASHSIEEFGCVSCHGGERLALDEETAHTGLIVNPTAPDTVDQYCGECHAGHVATVQRSIMTTYAGAIALVRRSFGLQSDGTAQYAAAAVGHLETFTVSADDPPAVQTFSENCLGCHVNGEGLPAEYFYRSTGCATCHVLYADDGLYQGSDPTISQTEAGHAQTHEFTTAIPYTQCNHCHNRGNYDFRTMSFIPRADVPAELDSEREQRVHDYYQPISQFTLCEWELDCIDCHTEQEIMGDGQIYNDRTEAQYTQCQTCHGTPDAPPLETVVTSPDELAMTLADLNPNVDLSVGDTIMVTERGEPLYNIRRSDDEWVLSGKATGETYTIPLVQGSGCTQDPANQVSSSCHECHTYDRETLP
jgi:hypothetical protein